MTEKYENLIRKVMLRKYPVITDARVKDRYEGWGYPFIDYSYIVYYNTDECLPKEMMQKIDEETKTLIKYFPKDGNPITNEHFVTSYFDCGNGYESHRKTN
jgi:hypothetical protein